MIYLDKDGQFQDTHEQFEKKVEEIGDEIIEGIEEDFKDQVEINTWHEDGSCCKAGTYWEVNWSPDLEKMIKEDLEQYKDEPYFEALEEYVRDNIKGEDELCEEKAENHFDDMDDNPY